MADGIRDKRGGSNLVILTAYLITAAVSGCALAYRDYYGKLLHDRGIGLELLVALIPIGNLFHALLSFIFDNVIEETSDQMQNANALLECKECGKYSRKYQRDLGELERRVKGKKSLGNCPHCEDGIARMFSFKKEHNWQAAHPDCPKLSRSGFIKYLKGKREIEAIVKQMESFEALQKYTEKGGNGK